MPSTTFHFPKEVLSRIDEAAGRRGVSRNKFVLAACVRALEEDNGVWPENFFTSDLDPEERELLREATAELEGAVLSSRRNRGAPLL